MMVCRQDKGFSMIQMLVVMAITAFLATLLIPAIGKSIDEARRVQCLSNMGQVYRALASYAADHQGRLPRGGTGATDESSYDNWGTGVWYKPSIPANGVPAYAGGQANLDRVMVCPTNLATNVPVSTSNPYGYPYVCNYTIMPQNGLSTPQTFLGNIIAAKVVLLLDSAKGEQWKGPGFTTTAGWDRIADRHDGRMNVLWADGRITTMRKAELKKEDLVPIPR